MNTEEHVREILDARLKSWRLPIELLRADVVIDYHFWSSINAMIAETYAFAAQQEAVLDPTITPKHSALTMAEIIQLQLAIVEDPLVVGMFSLLKTRDVEPKFARWVESPSTERQRLNPLQIAWDGLLIFISVFGEYVECAGAYATDYLDQIYWDLLQPLSGRGVSIDYLSTAAQSLMLPYRFMPEFSEDILLAESQSEGAMFVARMAGWANAIARLASPQGQ